MIETRTELAPVGELNDQVKARVDSPLDVLREAWLLSKESAHTRAAYRADFAQFVGWCHARGLNPLALVRVHVDAFREWLVTTEHRGRYVSRATYSSATIARKLTAVSSFYSYASKEAPRVVPANPAADVKRPEVSEDSTTEGLDLGEAQRVLAAAQALGALEHAVVRVLMSCGLRVSELCRADTADLGRERGHRTLTVTRKGGRRQKLPLPQIAAEVLDGYLGTRKGPLLLDGRGERLNRQQVAYLLARVARAAGVANRITPHSLRHSAATLALDSGESLRSVQALLGHRDPRTTNRYDRARHNLDRSAAHGLERYLGQINEAG